MNWILKRVLRFIGVLWTVVTVTFILVQFMPGGPADYIRAQLIQRGIPAAQIDQRVMAYLTFDPSTPIYEQYFEYMVNLLHGNLGQSIVRGAPVVDLISSALPYTLFLILHSLLLTFIIGILLGALSAFFEGGRFDNITTIASTVLSSIPFYVVALVSLFLLASDGGISVFPRGTPYGTSVEPSISITFIINLYYHAFLPIISMIIAGFGARAITMRANSISVLSTDYMRSGRLRGLGTGRLATRYVARNAILPMYTGLMISIGFMFSGSVILEQIFSWPGMGNLIYVATRARDFPLLLGALIVLAAVVLLAISIAEVTYGLLDPRVRENQEQKSGTSKSLQVIFRQLRSRISKTTNRQENTVNDSSVDQRNEIQRPGDLPEGVSLPSISEANSSEYRQWVQQSIVAPLKILFNDWRGLFGVAGLIFFILTGTVGPYMLSESSLNAAPAGIPPFHTLQHPLGTGGFGQDLLNEMVFATPPMLKIILSGSVLATGVATLIGTISGFKRGTTTDRFLMFITDTQLIIPGLPLILVLSAIFQPTNPFVIGLLLSIDSWPGLARNVRSEVLSVRQSAYVNAASLMGSSLPNIVRNDILPNIMPYILINFSNSARQVIYSSVGLYFLGILPFSNPNWGVILNDAYNAGALFRPSLLHWLLVPLGTIVVFSLCLILLSQSADKLFNPRLRAKQVESESTEPNNPIDSS